MTWSMSVENCNIKEFYSFIYFTFITRNRKNKSAPIDLETLSEIFYF